MRLIKIRKIIKYEDGIYLKNCKDIFEEFFKDKLYKVTEL